MQEWLKMHTYQRSSNNDQWYLALAHTILKKIDSLELFSHLNLEKKIGLAISITLYFEDTIAQAGGWYRFKEQIRRLYNREIPLYKTEVNTYMADEVNCEDIQFIMWCDLSKSNTEKTIEYTIPNPDSPQLKYAAELIYQILDNLFEEAPITEAKTIDWLIDFAVLSKKQRPLPSHNIEACKSENSRKFLSYTAGNPILFFDSYDTLKLFFIEVLNWENNPDALMPEMAKYKNFVLLANTKGLLMAPDVAQYFKASNNKLYNAEQTRKEGYTLFCEPGKCPFDLLKYGMKHNLLSDVELPMEQGKSYFTDNWDFIARWFLNEYYEGD